MVEAPRDALGQGLRVSDRDEEACLPLDHRLADPADGRRDDRDAGGLRLDHREAEALEVRRKGEHLERGEQVGDVAALTEQLEAVAKRSGELLEYVSIVRGHERAHVAFLKGALGNKAQKAPALDFGDTTSDPAKFIAAAIALEEMMIAAYNGQAANLTKGTLTQAAKIASVEARHAGWIRAIAGENPAPSATDLPKTAAQVQAELEQTGFIRSG